MLKEEIIDVLLRSPKYKSQSKYFLMKHKKPILQEMLDNIDVQIIDDSKITIVEETIVLDKTIEKTILESDLIILKEAFANIAPKEMSKFDWSNEGDTGALRVFVKQWKGKLRLKGFDLSKLNLKTTKY